MLEHSSLQEYTVGPRLLFGGPLGIVDFVLRALRALRPCDPRTDYNYCLPLQADEQHVEWGTLSVTEEKEKKKEYCRKLDVGSFWHLVI